MNSIENATPSGDNPRDTWFDAYIVDHLDQTVPVRFTTTNKGETNIVIDIGEMEKYFPEIIRDSPDIQYDEGIDSWYDHVNPVRLPMKEKLQHLACNRAKSVKTLDMIEKGDTCNFVYTPDILMSIPDINRFLKNNPPTLSTNMSFKHLKNHDSFLRKNRDTMCVVSELRYYNEFVFAWDMDSFIQYYRSHIESTNIRIHYTPELMLQKFKRGDFDATSLSLRNFHELYASIFENNPQKKNGILFDFCSSKAMLLDK